MNFYKTSIWKSHFIRQFSGSVNHLSRLSKPVLSNQLLLCHWLITGSFYCINMLNILPLFQFYRAHSSVSLTTILRCYASIQLQFPEVLNSFSLVNNSLQKLKLPDHISHVVHNHWGQGLFGGKHVLPASQLPCGSKNLYK